MVGQRRPSSPPCREEEDCRLIVDGLKHPHFQVEWGYSNKSPNSARPKGRSRVPWCRKSQGGWFGRLLPTPNLCLRRLPSSAREPSNITMVRAKFWV